MKLRPTQRHIRPAEGRRVHHQDGRQLLDADGETVTWSAYWQRRLNDGDVEEVKAVKAAKGSDKQTQKD